MNAIRISRRVNMPDPLRISRYQRAPELGPKILFFSGGSALTGLSRTLKHFTHNSIHLVTPFDSGGSSAKLRDAFNMPSIGDLRSRLIALADDSVTGHPEIVKLFAHRFPLSGDPEDIKHRLLHLARGKDKLISGISNPMRCLICNQLGYFLDTMPQDFDLHGASLGNLILAGGYLNNHQYLDPIIFLFSKLINVQGVVRATVNDHLHLGADLEDGRRILGQHRLTGKETAPLTSPIKRLFLTRSMDEYQPTGAELRKKVRKLIQNAELICYPPGSFFTSLLANLLPDGVADAIASNGNPKVLIPNLGQDPEQIGMDMSDVLDMLLATLRQRAPADRADADLVNVVLMDSKNGHYQGRLPHRKLAAKGIQLVDTHLVSKRSAPYYDNELLVSALLSLT
jgi:CofD-related protein of GAK system